MADSNFAATPYPTYNLGGDDDSVQHAVLTCHAGASIERNQDSQFSASRDQFTHRDVVAGTGKAREAALINRYELAVQLKDSEIRQTERLARIESKLEGMQFATLTRELGESKADARQGRLENVLEAILKKLP